jgi:hypothetical protein
VKGERKVGKNFKKTKRKKILEKKFFKKYTPPEFLIKLYNTCFEAGRHPCEREPEGSEGKWRRIFDLKILG